MNLIELAKQNLKSDPSLIRYVELTKRKEIYNEIDIPTDFRALPFVINDKFESEDYIQAIEYIKTTGNLHNPNTKLSKEYILDLYARLPKIYRLMKYK